MPSSYMLHLENTSGTADFPYAAFDGFAFGSPVVVSVPYFHLQPTLQGLRAAAYEVKPPKVENDIQIFAQGGELGLGYGHQLFLMSRLKEGTVTVGNLSVGSNSSLKCVSLGSSTPRFGYHGDGRMIVDVPEGHFALEYKILEMDNTAFERIVDMQREKAQRGNGVLIEHLFQTTSTFEPTSKPSLWERFGY